MSERLQRLSDVTLIVASLPLSLLPMGLIALWILLDGSASIIHRQTRVGRHGRLFTMHKFRTLHGDVEAGATIAADGDSRITRPGRFLRRWRLDELPQLYDVLRGAMSLVGPRPERPEHLRAIPAEMQRRVYRVRPGLTGPAAVRFLAEDEYLGTVADPEAVYCGVLLPEKLRIEAEYNDQRSIAGYLKVIGLTLRRVFSPAARRRSRRMIERLVATAIETDP